MIFNGKKLLASFLKKCKIISSTWTGEIRIGMNQGGVSWIKKTENEIEELEI